MTYKAILKGQLDFGTQRGYEQVLKMYQWRVENFYRAEILLKEEDIFDVETNRLVISKFSAAGDFKTVQNTQLLLDYVSQFAVAGDVRLWITEEGSLKKQVTIKPSNDRSVVKYFQEGVEAAEQNNHEEAIEKFTQCITKYPKHGNAYEERGSIYLSQQVFDKAAADFQESIKIYESNANAHFGLGQIFMMDSDYPQAIYHFSEAIKSSIPHEPIFWTSRYLKGECHAYLNEIEKAATEYRFFCTRNFEKDNPNFAFSRIANLKLGKAFLQLPKKEHEALKAFDAIFEYEPMEDGLSVGEIHLWRGIARHKVGKRGFLEDWKIAKKEGIETASDLLKKYA